MNISKRDLGLGNFAVLPDGLLFELIKGLELPELLNLSACSQVLLVFCREESVWLNLCLKDEHGTFGPYKVPPCTW